MTGPENWADLSDDELRARIANRHPDMPEAVIGFLVGHREDATGAIADILESRR